MDACKVKSCWGDGYAAGYCDRHAGERIAELENEVNTMLTLLAKARDENQRLRERIQNVLDGNYPQALKYEKCKHGLYGYDDCAQCVDDYLQAALNGEVGDE